MTAPARPRRRLATRLVAGSLLLFLCVQALVLAAVAHTTARNAERLLDGELAVAERVWQRLLAQRAATLTQGASVLAADYGFRDALSSDDAATVRSALANHGARIAADVVALLDPRLRLREVVAGDGVSAGTAAALARAWPTLGDALRGDRPALALVDGHVVQFVRVPVRAPAVIGHVVMGFEIDGRLLRDLRDVTGLEATLVVRPPGGTAAALASTLAAADATRLAGTAPGRRDAELDGGDHRLRAATVAADAGGAAALVLAGAVDRAVAPFHGLLAVLAALTAAGAAAFGLASGWLATRITAPLRELVRASDRLAAGDFDSPLPDAAPRDEVGDLGRAFEHMRRSVAAHEREIRHLAYTDRLTGLPNRARFREAVAASRRAGEPLAVLMLDVDRFKHVNDVLGYAVGDRLLCALAERLDRGIAHGPGALLARLGGDEFGLLLPGAGEAVARAAADALHAALAEPLSIDDQRVDVGAGIGIALAPAHATDADLLMSRAEVAMYAAKRTTDGLRLYDPTLDAGSARTLSLLSDLRDALAGDQLRLHLQPKVRVRDGRLCGAEALVRWQHPQRGLVPPMEFIPFAEQTGFIRRLTLWVVEEAARRQPALAALGVERLSVNLSTRDLLDVELPVRLDAILARHGASASGFRLEITESAIMDDPERAEATLHRLAERGFELSIDDFGTGYSSLAYLRRLPVHELKIDKGFVMAMERQPADAQIVRSTIDLAHALGLRVVAEGVENATVHAMLDALGCDEAQGWHFGRPVAWPEFERRFAAGVTAGTVEAAASARPAEPFPSMTV